MKTQFLAWAGSGILTATGAGLFFKGHILKIFKAIKISRDVLDILDEGVTDSTDGKLTPEEVQKIIDLFTKLKGDLK